MIIIIINAILLIVNIVLCVTADKITPLNLVAIVFLSIAITLGVVEKYE